jgi:NADH dehydrogenase/NADH:ubiquinone oxidoreductase subunit G
MRKGQKMVSITLDGNKTKVEGRATVLEAARQAGIAIPSLCAHPGLSGLGNCRLCVVEVERKGRKRIVTSCNYPVEEGLAVVTGSERIRAIRRMIIELLAARSPHVKVIREFAEEMGIEKPRFTVENEKCILCGLCVQVCDEYVGAHAITFSGHGTGKFVTAPLQRSAADCTGCGACVAVCPAQCITMQDVTDARTYGPGGGEEVGQARLIHNWNARIPWKQCRGCGKAFAPPSPIGLMEAGKPLPKDFFSICDACRK